MTILDRYILRSLVANYLIALTVMMSLYVMLDLFVNMDEFTEGGFPLPVVLRNIADFYWPNLFLYFSQLSSVITLFACLSVVARLRYTNELTAVLASGVSLYRIAVPIVAFGIASTLLLVVDTEWFIPSVAHKLARDHDDADGTRAYEVLFLKDRDDALLCAGRFYPNTSELQRVLVLKRDENGRLIETLEAERATWGPSDSADHSGSWHLERARRRTRMVDQQFSLGPQETVRETYPVTYESDLSPETIELRQTEGWFRFLSLRELGKLAGEGTVDHRDLIQARHARVTSPILSLAMLLLGLPFFLDRLPRSVLTDTGKCMLACGTCYMVAFFGQSVRLDFNSALPFWIPIFVFTTLAMVLLDRVRT
ncbi:MAG: LptF/LptG family permease [Planctomycetota bacterium]